MLTVFGAISVDLVFALPYLPGAGDTVRSDGGSVAPGGKGAHQATAAARDGARVGMHGAVGGDRLADIALHGLAEAGVGLRGVARIETAVTGRAAIGVAQDGHILAMIDIGANALARAEQVADSALRGQTLLAEFETEPVEIARLVLRARALGARIVLNVSPRRPTDADVLRAADVLVGNAQDMAWLGERLGTGSNAASIHAALGVPAVRMLGVQGAEVFSADGWTHMPALPEELVHNTIAEDCFVGVLAGSLARRTPLVVALRRATVAAGLAARNFGRQATLPSTVEIDLALVRAPEPTRRQDEVPD